MRYIVVVVLTAVCELACGQPAKGRIAYADIGYIVSRLPQFKDAQAQYQEAEKDFNTQLQQKGDYFRKQYQDYIENGASLPDTARANRERHLQETRASINDFQAEAQKSLGNYQKLLLGPLYLAVNSAVKRVAAENGYALVLSAKIGEANLTLYHDPAVDISDLVIKSMVEQSSQADADKPAPKKN